MASTQISSKYPPYIDLTRAQQAYGLRALPKLNRELRDKQLLTRQRALMTLSDKLHNPEHVAEAISVGVITNILRLLKDQDVTVREKATECTYIISSHAIGKKALLRTSGTRAVSNLYDDCAAIVRIFAHRTMGRIAGYRSGAQQMINADLIPKLVSKLQCEEDSNLKEHILDTLHFCLTVEASSALICGAMEVLKQFLRHDRAKIRAKAALAIMDICFTPGGKEKACEIDCLSPLVLLLQDNDAETNANAAGALMAISTTTRGKFATFQAGAIPFLLQLIEHKNSEVRVNAMKALTAVAEIPDARATLLENIEKLQRRLADSNLAVRKHANIAVGVVTWKP